MHNQTRLLAQTTLLGSIVLILSACASNAPRPTGGVSIPGTASTAGTNGTAPLSVARPLTGPEINRELTSKGWQFVGASGPSNDPNLIYIRPSSYQKINDLAKVTTYNVYGNEASRNYGNNRASSFGWEVSCSAKTTKIVSHQIFKDTLGSVLVSNRTVTDAPITKIASGTIPATIYSKVCDSGPSSGTGVAVGAGSVLTASHVVNKCSAVEAIFDGKRYPATVKAQDIKNDLGLLEVQALPIQKAINLRRNAVNGESVMAAGYPLSGLLSSDLIVTTGIVNSLAGLANDPSQIQVSAQVSPGNSGGGLLDKSGNLVGIVVSKLDVIRAAAVTGDMAQNVNFAVKPEVVRMFLDANGVRMNASDASIRLEGEDLAQRAREFTVKVECKSRPPAILSSL
jgi:S1-C subfamily serine protease